MEPTIEQAKKDIANAASEATKVIARAAFEAAKVVSEAASGVSNQVKMPITGDHDLLIELKTKMEGLKSDILGIKEGTTDRIKNLEESKLDTKDSYLAVYKKAVDESLSKIDDRVKNIETTRNSTNILLSIGIGLMIIMSSMLIFHLFGIKI